jgi:hypothetical protein
MPEMVYQGYEGYSLMASPLVAGHLDCQSATLALSCLFFCKAGK